MATVKSSIFLYETRIGTRERMMPGGREAASICAR